MCQGFPLLFREEGFHLVVKDLNLIGFKEAFLLQEMLSSWVPSGKYPETLLLLEHTPVYTIGRGGSVENVLDPSIEVVRINRGGDITFHGPGQLVGYPIIDLAPRGRDLHRYVRFLEEVLIRAAADFNVEAFRLSGKTGVWTELGKLASIGVGVRKWVTMHGFALNVSTDIGQFDQINPCGIPNCAVTTLQKNSPSKMSMVDVKSKVSRYFVQMMEEYLPYAGKI